MTRVWGITEMPLGERASYNPDMQSEKLVGAIESQGARLAWTRAAHCPCQGVNSDTDQPDPNCALCKGLGTIWFGPTDYAPAAAVGELDEVQQAILAVDGAAVIRGVMGRFARSMTHEEKFFDTIGRWRSGESIVTVRPENRLGFQDRLVNLDAVIVHSEYVRAVAGAAVIPLRYRAISINLLRSISTVYTENTHFQRADDGTLSWAVGEIPSADTAIVAHYLTHPTWRIADMPHSTREIARRHPRLRTGPATPHGQPVDLPIAAIMALEMLPVK